MDIDHTISSVLCSKAVDVFFPTRAASIAIATVLLKLRKFGKMIVRVAVLVSHTLIKESLQEVSGQLPRLSQIIVVHSC